MKALDYVKPADLEEAYDLLNSRKKSSLLAGGLFVRLHKKTHPLLIDLEGLGLDYIKEEDDHFKIGAMTTIRSLENSDLPKAIVDAVKQISGVGVRNMATIGGSVSGRFPFSDINTALMALNTDLVFFKNGTVSMRSFYEKAFDDKDILMEIIVKKTGFSSTKYFKKVYTDFSLVNVSLTDDTLAIGARPGRTKVISTDEVTVDLIDQFEFKDDYRASAEYRKALAKALLEDLIIERSNYGS